MDTVVLDGVEYVKASVAAKQFRYTSDYIGQLCRGKKIDARLVGRTWFVNPESIEKHKQTKHKKRDTKQSFDTTVSVSSIQDSDIDRKTKPNRIRVTPIMKSKTARALGITDKTGDIPTKKLAVHYEPDNETLLPQITRKQTPPPQAIAVTMAGAKEVKIRKRAAQQTNFTAEEVPSVALSGKLVVSALEEPSKPEVAEEPEEVKEAEKEHFPVVKPVKTLARPKNTKKTHTKSTGLTSQIRNTNTDTKKTAEKSVASHVNAPIKQQAQQFSPRSVQIQSVTPSLFMRFSPVFATAVAIVFMLLIFAASSQVVTSDAENTSRVVFQLANLQAVLSQ